MTKALLICIEKVSSNMLAVISVTKLGDEIGRKINNEFGGKVYYKSKIKNFSLDEIVKEAFKECDSIIFISSTGIAVRVISSYLKSKDVDPAVVVVDVCNKFTISLVSGHLGGANKLALEVSNLLENTPVITTATDNLNKKAPDIIAKENNLIIESLDKAKEIAARLVNGKSVYFKDDLNKIKCPKGYINSDEIKKNMLWITDRLNYDESILRLIRKNIVLGIGCRKNTSSEKMINFIEKTLEENEIDIRSVKVVASIDIKSDEKAILDLKDRLNVDLKFFTKEEIKKVHNNYEGSDFVEKNIGVRAVSQPVVELLGGEIIIDKIKFDGITLTVGRII